MALLLTEPGALKLTADGDLDRSVNRVQFASGLDAVVQGVRMRMLLCKGEWFANLDVGVPYLERDGVPANEALLGQVFHEAKALAAFRRAILATPGVKDVVSLTALFDPATRNLSVTWRASTVFGETPADSLTTVPT